MTVFYVSIQYSLFVHVTILILAVLLPDTVLTEVMRCVYSVAFVKLSYLCNDFCINLIYLRKIVAFASQ